MVGMSCKMLLWKLGVHVRLDLLRERCIGTAVDVTLGLGYK